MLTALGRSRCLLSYEAFTGTLSGSREELLHPLAGGRSCRTCSSRFEKLRLDPCSQRFSRAPSRPHALPRLLQVDVSTSTTTDHSRHPRPLESGWGGCHRRVESCLSTGTTAGASQGQGPRTPYLGTPRRDCSRRRLRPDLDDSGHLLSRGPLFSLSGATGETGGTASAARACRAHGATGSCGAPPPRRGGTLTNPRGLLSTDCSQANRRIGRRTSRS